MTCGNVERDIDLYVDRELEQGAQVALREHLRECLSCRRRVDDRGALSRLVRSLPYHSAPAHLRARVLSQAKRSYSTRHVVAWAAAAALALSVSGGIALLRSSRTVRASGDVVEDVINGHVRSLMVDHLLDVQSTDQHTVKPWFTGKLDFAPPVLDLAALGYPLVGGRVDYVSGRAVAVLVYQRQQHIINVFVWPAGDGAPDTLARSMRGFHVHHWIRDGMSSWAVSDLNEAELSELVRALQSQ